MQIAKAVAWGATRIGVSNSVSGVNDLLAFSTGPNQVGIAGYNSNGTSAALSIELTGGFSGISTMELYETNASSLSFSQQSDVPVSANAASVTVPAGTYFTLLSKTPSINMDAPTNPESTVSTVDSCFLEVISK